MSHAITFDTHEFIKTLEKSGIEPKQAEAIQKAVGNIFDDNLDSVATKNDINLLKKDIEALGHQFEAKLSKNKSETIMWIVGLLFVQCGILISVIKLIH